MNGTVLIVDDKEKLCKILAQNFNNVGYTCFYALNGKDAIKRFSSEVVDAVVLDLKLDDQDGLSVMKSLMEVNASVPIIIVTGYATIESAVEAIKIGAFDYIQKPVNFTKLQRVMENAIKMARLHSENRSLRSQLINTSTPIITQDKGMREVMDKLTRIAQTEYPILLYGESGTGKELFSDFIHLHSARSDHRLFKLNCASLPDSLLDNELFGHNKGAYTGADSDFPGIFERADKGSLFLDEIADMPLEIQAKILRTLQNHEVRRLGGKEVRTIDVRFIAATNKDLHLLMREGKFREDLFYRLNTALMHIPSLRDRRADIPLLVSHFLTEHASENASGQKMFDVSSMKMLMEHNWPGNVRELKNVVNYAAAISTGSVVGIRDLPPYLHAVKVDESLARPMDHIEKGFIMDALMKNHYNKKKTAEMLKISRRTLYNKLEKYGIDA